MLFRSQPENYNPQIHTEELSLASQMDKNPAVHNTVLSRFKRYTPVTSFLYHTGRVNGGAKAGLIRKASKEIADNAYRVQKRTLNIQPAYAMGGAHIGEFFSSDDMTSLAPNTINYTNGTSDSTIETNVIGSVAVQHDPSNQIFGDKFNIADVIELDGGFGSELYIVGKRLASTGDHYIYDFKVIGKTSDWHEDSFKKGEVFMEGGNRYGEGSLKGHQRFWGTSWDIFYNFISRYSLSFTGSSLSQQRVIWTDKTLDGANGRGGRRLWQYEVEWYADEMFAIFLELACRYSKSTMDPSTHSWFESSGKNLLTSAHLSPEVGITPPRTSDGWVTSIKDTLDFSYDVNSGPSMYLIEGVMNILAGNSPSGQQGNTFLVVTDNLGNYWLDRALKTLIGWNTQAVASGGSLTQGHTTNVVQDISSGQNVKLGFNVQSYTYLGNELIVVVDELMSHPGLVGRSGGIAGRGDMIFLNVTPMDNGVSNFELFSKSNGRVFIKKYVDGLHSLNGNTMFASSGFDGAFCHYLADLFPITYFKDTSCVLRGDGKYNGGALSGIPNAATQLARFPAITNQ